MRVVGKAVAYRREGSRQWSSEHFSKGRVPYVNDIARGEKCHFAHPPGDSRGTSAASEAVHFAPGVRDRAEPGPGSGSKLPTARGG